MARESVKILQGKLDVESLISQLNAALAEEWLAYYQYWVGALVVEGAMRADVQSEFEEHAEEETPPCTTTRQPYHRVRRSSGTGPSKMVRTSQMQI